MIPPSKRRRRSRTYSVHMPTRNTLRISVVRSTKDLISSSHRDRGAHQRHWRPDPELLDMQERMRAMRCTEVLRREDRAAHALRHAADGHERRGAAARHRGTARRRVLGGDAGGGQPRVPVQGTVGRQSRRGASRQHREARGRNGSGGRCGAVGIRQRGPRLKRLPENSP